MRGKGTRDCPKVTLALVGVGFQEFLDAAVHSEWPEAVASFERIGNALELHADTPDGKRATTKMSAAAGRHKLDGDPARHGLMYERELAHKVDVLAQAVKNMRLIHGEKNKA